MKQKLNSKFFTLPLVLLCVLTSHAQQYKWATSIRGGAESTGNGIATDANYNVISTGFFSETVDFDPGSASDSVASVANSNDVYIQKLDSSGNMLWTKTMGSDDVDAGNAIVTDASGNIYVAGYFSSVMEFNPTGTSTQVSSNGNTDAFVAKLSPAGDLQWVKTFGGQYADAVNAMAFDRTGNLYLTGYFSDAVDFDPGAGTSTLTSAGSKDIFVLKLDANGDFAWAKAMGGSTDDDVANALAIDTAQNVVVAGSFIGTGDFDPNSGTSNLVSNGYNDAFITKLSSAGDLMWAKSVGSIDYDDGARGVAVDVNNNTILTGYYRGDVDFDPGTGVANFTWQSYNDVFLLKLNNNGDYQWTKTANGSAWEEGYALTTDYLGNIYSTGYFESDVDFDPNAGVSTLTSAGGSDVYIQKLTGAGNLVWAKSVSGTGNDEGNAIALDLRGNVYTTGYFGNVTDFDPNSGVASITAESHLESAFQLKWNQVIPTGIAELQTLSNVSAYPNPVKNALNVSLDKPYNDISAEVNNELGQLVSTERFENRESFALNTNSLVAGIYFIRLTADGNTSVLRIVKQ